MSVRAWLMCETEGCPSPDSRVLLAKKFTSWRAWQPENPAPGYEPMLEDRMNVFFELHVACEDEFKVVIE